MASMRTGNAPEYRGDAHLRQLLEQAGLDRSVEAVRDLVAGVQAAPASADPDAWMVLLGVDDPAALPAGLRDQLQALLGTLGVEGPGKAGIPERVTALRAELKRRGLDGFVVPRSDEHQGEYVPKRAERLAWITGFSGSAGMAAILADSAALFVDGRYTLQAQAETPADIYEYRHLVDDPLGEWILAKLPQGGRIGYDPWLHTPAWVERLRPALERAGGALVAVEGNPIDAVWTGQPPSPIAPVVPYEQRFAGRSAEEKCREIAGSLQRDGIAAAVLTQPDSIAWLLNLRGGDVPRTPLPLSFAILRDDASVQLFIDRRKLAPGVPAHLGNRVSVQEPDTFGPALDELAAGGRVRVDPSSAAAWIFDRLQGAGAKVERGPDPCQLPKACKNEVELAGIRRAHERDAVAVARFLAWLSRTAPETRLGEIEAAQKLLDFRRRGERFKDLSFDTISGAGPNGAIVHYRVSPATERRLEPGSLYLVDSGAQYLDGTTDITRTVAIGQPSPEMRERFTLVLKGHIALATARFPKGTTGSQLDALARQFLWSHGLDYDHGTGHGVGCYLSVHEGPQRISKVPSSIALLPGMVVSNEPGYYKTGAYGIRIENLVAVRPCEELSDTERPMLEFETLTLAPIDLNLVEPSLMTAPEIAWLNAYHARVRTALLPHLDGEDGAWLTEATTPILV